VRAALPVAGATAIACAAVVLLAAPSAGPPPSGPAVVDVLVVPPAGSADVATGFEHGEGRIVTVAHLLPARSARVLVRSGEGPARQARVVALDRRGDLAVLELGAGASRPSPLPGSESPRLLVRRDGRPAAIEATVRRRIDASIRPRPGAPPVLRPALELEARVRQGDSGAPLVAADGRLLGVLFAQSSGPSDTAYAVAAERLPNIVRRVGPRRRPPS
jgi:S1-C subfamily serine protease